MWGPALQAFRGALEAAQLGGPGRDAGAIRRARAITDGSKGIQGTDGSKGSRESVGLDDQLDDVALRAACQVCRLKPRCTRSGRVFHT